MTIISNRHQLADSKAIREFLLAGRAVITLKSLKTQEHYTFQVTKKNAEGSPSMWFVKVLSGHNNWTTIGGIHEVENFNFRRPLRMTPCITESPTFKAFKWFWAGVLKNQKLPTSLLEVWHEGRCGRCGRPLTHPESIASGIGPECSKLITIERSLAQL